jgi:dTDP-glucose pyrophosphorylase
MKNWEQALIGLRTPLRLALQAIDRASCQMALVVDADRRLLGTLSDGDIRRGLLNGASLDEPVEGVMHRHPTYARPGDGRADMLALMRDRGLRQVPVLDSRGCVVGLETLDDFLVSPERDNWVVIMAGGLGSRLAELTRETPKPMLPVGSRPVLETIIRSFEEQGFRRFHLAVNYKAEQIEAHFGDGSAFGVEIRYLRERERLGTAGALSLLPEVPSEPILVTNGDLLAKEDYGAMVDRHVRAGVDATMAVRDYEMQVPFGVVREHEGCIATIDEKPVLRFMVNAGMYVLSRRAVARVPHAQYFDMPALFQDLVAAGYATRTHRIAGYWLDIGRIGDYERANHEFGQVFR